jgi:GNAT superfamily N-acetyltransferase
MDKTDKTDLEISVLLYDKKYFADMLFCYLAAKDAVGKYAPDPQWGKPALKEDMLDIDNNYIKRGEVFYLAVDKDDRVAGMIGTKTVSETDIWLKRLFVKPDLKGRGIGSKLLLAVEDYASAKGVTTIHTRFADWYREAASFYPAKGFADAGRSGYLRHMVKSL